MEDRSAGHQPLRAATVVRPWCDRGATVVRAIFDYRGAYGFAAHQSVQGFHSRFVFAKQGAARVCSAHEQFPV